MNIKNLFLMLTVLLAAISSFAAEGEIFTDLNATVENPRKSEGDFIRLKSGRILFIYAEFYGGRGDASPAHLVSIFSDDAGKTWSEKPEMVVPNKGEQNVMSVSLLRLKSGKIAMFYLVKHGFHDCRPYLQISDDEANTWSEPQLTVAPPGYFVLNNDRVIQTSTGRLIMPLAFHRQRGASNTAHSSFDKRAIAMWFYSDDEGKTWRESDDWWALQAHTQTGMQEPGIVELSNGTLLSWARTDQNYQYACISTNDGKNWSAPQPTTLRSPTSPATIERLPGSSDLLAIYNDVSNVAPGNEKKRTPLVSAISKDNGKTWINQKVIEPDPDGWFCYTAMEFVDDAVLLAYCAGDKKEKLNSGLNRTRIRRIDISSLRGQ
ncbi:MAG: exo-alpha-sialidase [Verrucomicrobia bacterium]|nr:exo-alpha-sialidase [Verrucomicrobiota bacterium]